MKARHCLSIATIVLAQSGFAQSSGVEDSGYGFYEPEAVECVSSDGLERMRALVLSQRQSTGSGAPLTPVRIGSFPSNRRVRLEWPIRAVGAAALDFGATAISNFVDDNRGAGQLVDYLCGTRTYNQHSGIDIFTWPFAWNRMADDEVQAVAAAEGTIISKVNGYPDQSCSLNGLPANSVAIQHIDGSVAFYLHLKRDSLTSRSVGSFVRTGDYLGVIGSSGNSTGPHLHLSLRDKDGRIVDPFPGPCNELASMPTWKDPRPYYDTAVNRMQVGTAPVAFGTTCGELATINSASSVPRGGLVYFTTFFRDQLSTTPATFRVYMPGGSLFRSWIVNSSTTHYSASWWWRSLTISSSAPTGTWTYECDIAGKTRAVSFEVF